MELKIYKYVQIFQKFNYSQKCKEHSLKILKSYVINVVRSLKTHLQNKGRNKRDDGRSSVMTVTTIKCK